jgi:hypothetical protein
MRCCCSGRGERQQEHGDEHRALLEPWRNRRRAGAGVKRIAQAQTADLDRRRIADMSGTGRTLERLVHGCRSNDRPDCPILDELADARDHANVRLPRRENDATTVPQQGGGRCR